MNAPEDELTHVVAELRTELQSIRERELLASTPPPADLGPVEAAVIRLGEQLDALRTSVADRFDAVAAPDLAPVHEALGALRDQVRSISAPDLTRIEVQVARLDQQVARLPDAEDLARAIPSVDALREADRTDEVIAAIATSADALREDVAGVADGGRATAGALEPLQADVGRLATATDAARRDLAAVTAALAGLTQLAEAGDARLNGLTDAQHAAVTEQRSAVTHALNELARQITTQVQAVESRLAELTARTSALDGVQEGLARVREEIAGLGARVEQSHEAQRSDAVEHALTLSRMASAADGIASSLAALRASITGTIDASRDAVIEAVDARTGARIDETIERFETQLAERLQSSLNELGISQLRRSVADVTAQVVESRADARTLRESVAALEQVIERAAGDAVAPVVESMEELQTSIANAPAPDLGPVAAQLARLSATIASQARHEAASPGDVAELRTTLEGAVGSLAERIDSQTDATREALSRHIDSTRDALGAHADETRDGLGRQAEAIKDLVTRQAAATQDVLDRLARMPSEADRNDELRRELEQAHLGLHAAVDRLAADVTAAREAVERRPGSRWRRGGGGEEVEASRAQPGSSPVEELEQRLGQLAHDVDHRLASLAQLADRAAASAEDAAQAAAATLRVVSNPPAPSTAPPRKAPLKAAPAKRAPAEKAAPAEKSTKRTGIVKKAAAKKAQAPAKKKAAGSSEP